MSMSRVLVLILFCACVLCISATTVRAQTVTENAAKALVSVAEAKKAVVGVSKPEAVAAATAAESAAKASTEAATAGERAAASAKDSAAMLKGVQTDAANAAKAAGAAATAAAAAANAAVQAEAIVTIEPAKARAAQAAAAAQRAAIAAAGASKTANTENTTVAGAMTLQPAQKAAALVAEETLKAATEASTAALRTSEAAREAATPSLPVTGPRDERLLSALRAQFTGGAIFFNGAPRVVVNGTEATIQSQQFGQAAMYLAFEAQPRLWSGNINRCSSTDTECLTARGTSIRERGYNRIYVDPFVNVRLTTIPVTGVSQEGRIGAPTEAFLQSQKAAQVQLGTQGGVNFGKFSIGDTNFHWGFGPVFRFMFQSVTDAQRSLRVWDLDDDLFNLRSYGSRLTLYEKDRAIGDNVRDGWAPAAYIDVSWGDFQNFQTAIGTTDAAKACLASPKTCLATGLPPESEFERIRKNRYYIEGRVFLQYLYLGFDINNGPGPDDMRFIFGLTAKLDTFFARR